MHESAHQGEPHKMRRWDWAGLLALTALAYANGLRGGFLFDDPLLIGHAWRQTPFAHWGWGLPNPLGHAAERPLVTFSFFGDFALFGQNPTGYHVVNLIFHLLNTALAFSLLWRLGLSRWGAWLAALIFAIHPVQTESVTYISGRRDLLLGLFFLLCFHLYLRWRERLFWKRGLALAALAALGLGAKETLYVLPALWLWWEATTQGRPWSTTQGAGRDAAGGLVSRLAGALRERGWFYLCCLLLGAPLIVLRVVLVREIESGRSSLLIGGALGTHVMSAAKARVLLLWRLLFPVHLLADYGRQHPLYATGWDDPLGWLALAALAAFAAALFLTARKHAWVSLGLATIALCLLPSSQIIPHQELVTEHYLYLPLLGFGLLVARAHLALRSRCDGLVASRLVAAATALLLSGYLVRDWARNRDYQDPVTFWSQVERSSPGSARAQVSLGLYEWMSGKDERGLARFLRATELDPKLAGAWANAGVFELRAGRPEKALPLLERAARIEPNHPDLRLDLAETLARIGRHGEAWEHLEWVRANSPTHPRYATVRALVLRGVFRETVGEPAKSDP